MPKQVNQLSKSEKAQTASPPPRSPLPLFLAGGALLVIIVGVVWLATSGRGAINAGGPAQVAGRPALAVDRTLIDFGKVPLDVSVRATFRLSNVGDRPLQILNQPVVEVKAGCWPPRPVVRATTLQPGQSTELSYGIHDVQRYGRPA